LSLSQACPDDDEICHGYKPEARRGKKLVPRSVWMKGIAFVLEKDEKQDN
jgi:hypothetical protein